MKLLLPILILLNYTNLYAQHRTVETTDQFTIVGQIKKERTFHMADLMKCKQNALGDVIVRNHKGDPKDTVRNMKGILLKDLLDSVEIKVEKPKEYSEFCILLTASDGYKNVYSWNEIFNSDIGNHLYIITEMNGRSFEQMDQRILVMSLADINSGRRHLKGLTKIELKKVE